jgi:hypothetical protein
MSALVRAPSPPQSRYVAEARHLLVRAWLRKSSRGTLQRNGTSSVPDTARALRRNLYATSISTIRRLQKGVPDCSGRADRLLPHTKARPDMGMKSRTLSPEVLARRIDPRAAAALLDAVGRNDLAQLAILLDAGANPGSRSGTSPALHVAAQLGHVAIAARLLDAGADIDAVAHTDELIDGERVAGSETALMCSLRAGREDVALLLLARGARLDHRDAFGGADALLLAAEKGLERVVERILERGPAPQARLFNEKSALDVAVEGGHGRIVRRLLAAGFPTTPAAARLVARE